MLRLTMSAEEYLMIGDDIKIVFLGGTKNHQRIMIDAPKDVNIARSKAMANRMDDPEAIANMPKYYVEQEHPEKYLKNSHVTNEPAERKRKGNIIITKGNLEDR